MAQSDNFPLVKFRMKRSEDVFDVPECNSIFFLI